MVKDKDEILDCLRQNWVVPLELPGPGGAACLARDMAGHLNSWSGNCGSPGCQAAISWESANQSPTAASRCDVTSPFISGLFGMVDFFPICVFCRIYLHYQLDKPQKLIYSRQGFCLSNNKDKLLFLLNDRALVIGPLSREIDTVWTADISV